jgi:deoxyribodipyrimidine photo-lyase
MSIAIWWIRRDLRLTDNQALAKAMVRADAVLPVFILDPKLLDSTKVSQLRIDFLLDGLYSLDIALRQRGSRLIVRQGEPQTELTKLSHETSAVGIFAQADVSPFARRRDERIGQALPLELTPGITIQPVEAVVKPDGSPYTIFTPFSKKWWCLPLPGRPISAPDRFQVIPAVPSLEIPNPHRGRFPGGILAGEAEASRKLKVFVDTALRHYAADRDRLDIDGTSGLSPYMRFGMISARQATWIANEAIEAADQAEIKKSALAWLNELTWREYFASILHHFPHILKGPYRHTWNENDWRDDQVGLTAWKEGRSGFPVVDAAMRQMNETGWMPNRARMITASFLVKDLLINWRRGEQYFMQHLLDGDPAANNGGWQWVAGTGSDASPIFRVFNPVLQGKKYDPHGNFVRKWIPELGEVPEEFIHTPWTMPDEVQRRVKCRIGKDYPAPIVDHGYARQRILDIYRRNKT